MSFLYVLTKVINFTNRENQQLSNLTTSQLDLYAFHSDARANNLSINNSLLLCNFLLIFSVSSRYYDAIEGKNPK